MTTIGTHAEPLNGEPRVHTNITWRVEETRAGTPQPNHFEVCAGDVRIVRVHFDLFDEHGEFLETEKNLHDHTHVSYAPDTELFSFNEEYDPDGSRARAGEADDDVR